MRKIFAFAIALLLLGIFGFALNSKKSAQQNTVKSPCGAASTQLELNECGAEEFHKAYAQLNIV